jgi:hypothetical protein
MLEFIVVIAPFSGRGCYEPFVFNPATMSLSRRRPTKNKNSTPARSPEVLSAAHAVWCEPIHGQDSDWSGPWVNRRDAADTARL